MQTDLETLTKLLQELHQELKTCMENEEPNSGMADPILLGDFIVDSYNSYLASAKITCDNTIIQAMPDIEKVDGLADDAHDDTPDNRDDGRVGKNPQLQKMREVAFATKQLQTVLEGEMKTREAKTEGEIFGAMTLLENLGEQMEQEDAIREDSDSGDFLRSLLEEYNRCLGIVLESEEDTVLPKLFRPLEVAFGETTSYQEKLSELRLAQSGLLSYLKKMNERMLLTN